LLIKKFTYSARLTDKTQEEMQQLCMNHSNVWSILCILNVLHSLVDISNIKKQLEAISQSNDPQTVAGEFGELSFYKMLGYYTLVGLLRVHSLLCDYYQAIKVLEPIDPQEITVFAHTGLSDFDIVLRQLRLHDDAPLCGRHTHILRHFAVHTAHQAAVQHALLPKRPH